MIYDSLHGRWVAIELSWDCTTGGGAAFGHGYLDIAISRTNNPRGLWDSYYRIYNDTLPDYPGIGTSTDKVVLSANVFQMGPGADCVSTTPLGTDFTGFDWADLVNGGGLGYAATGVLDSRSIVRPAVQSPATSAAVYWVSYGDDSGSLVVNEGTVTGSVTARTFDVNGTTLADLVSRPLEPPTPQQGARHGAADESAGPGNQCPHRCASAAASAGTRRRSAASRAAPARLASRPSRTSRRAARGPENAYLKAGQK